MKVGLFQVSALLLVAGLAIGQQEETKFVCKDNVRYVENKCNECNCGGGQLACTRKMCPEVEQLRNCTRGSSWKEACEQCWCTEMGTICTINCGETIKHSGSQILNALDISVMLCLALSLKYIYHYLRVIKL